MKKVALVFMLAVLAPSLVLAWLAVRSLRDQQFLLERQQSLLDQRLTDGLAQNIADYLARQQQDFGAQVEGLAATQDTQKLATQFDDQLRQRWPLAEVGFCVTTSGKILSPQPNARPAAQMFRLDNAGFLANREPVEVYNTRTAVNGGSPGPDGSWGWGHSPSSQQSLAMNENSVSPPASTRQEADSEPQRESVNSYAASPNADVGRGVIGNDAPKESGTPSARPGAPTAAEKAVPQNPGWASSSGNTANNLLSNGRNVFYIPADNQAALVQRQQLPTNNTLDNRKLSPPPRQTVIASAKDSQQSYQGTLNYKSAQYRKVSPQSQTYENRDRGKAASAAEDSQNNVSRVVPAEAEFRQLIGDQTDGLLARFLQNKLKLMCWHRLASEPTLIFGAQLDLNRVVEGLRGLVQSDSSRGDDICLAVLDENARPMVVSRDRFQANWKRPFVATEVGDALPHWEVAAYLVDPARLTQAARTARLTLGLLIGVLVVAIGVGSLLIVRSLNAELKLARQKTDFVSSVSHELKTPLTSIRMFSELLAEGRVADPAKHRSYLQIITAEAARLTRLINNVLDFSRMERGEKKYNFQACDLAEIVRAAAETYRPHLEAAGFRFACALPSRPIPIRGDADAVSQVLVNLLSNAEKYSNGGKEISLELSEKQSPLPHAEVRVLDRGPGVPHGCEEKVFEKFYRAHDSLSSGIQGSGLGLTIARQIARAHGGDVTYEPCPGGGSCFSLRLPVPGS